MNYKMNKFFYWMVAVIAVLFLVLVFMLAKYNPVGATSIKGQLGDECDTQVTDESHDCLEGLVCIPQNENSEGNGKCGYESTPTPSCTPTATPTGDPEPSATPSAVPTVTPTEGPHDQPYSVPDTGCAVRDCSVHPTFPATVLGETGQSKATIALLVAGLGAILVALGIMKALKS